jgi:vitamin B12 transporter
MVTLSHVGARDDFEYSGWATRRVRLEAFSLWGASATWNVRKGAEVFLRLDNILDQAYELVKGYGTPRLSLYAGVRFDL